MFTHALAREMDDWCTEHLRDHDDPAYHDFLQYFNEGLLVKQDEQRAAHTNGGRFGMSKAGGCTRVSALKALGYGAAPFPGSTLVTFEIGHHLEVMAIAILRAMGKEVNGTQAEVTIDPFMLSYSDGIINEDGPAILSVKSTGYKFSANRRGKWIRQGFTCLPFEGLRSAQPGWWVQAQAEMHGSGIPQTMFVVIAKDIVQAFKDDPYMQQSGSLTFYCEMVEYDRHFCETQLVPIWQETWDSVQSNKAPAPYVYNAAEHNYVKLPKVADVGVGWGGPNQQATGTFNHCNACDMGEACKQAVVAQYRRAS